MSTHDLQPRRDLTLTHATSLVVGIIIGTGIFLKSATMAQAVGSMGRNAAGKTAMLSVTLRPRVRFSGEHVPTRADIVQLHERAHEECFIANSVTTAVHIEPVFHA